MFKRLLVSVPDFRKEVEDEPKPAFFNGLSKQDQEDYIQNLVTQRQMKWTSQTAASAYNLCIIIFGILLLVDGFKLLSIAQDIVGHYMGKQ